jgi:1-acyl-sn-glycerol-3-phosphate acyltransferase
MHGHLYIILKESIKYIPILGSGMMFFGFIFLSRKWSTDKERFRYRLKKLSTSHAPLRLRRPRSNVAPHLPRRHKPEYKRPSIEQEMG